MIFESTCLPDKKSLTPVQGAGTIAKTKTWMLLPRHLRHVKDPIDTVCLKDSLLGDVELLMRQIVHEKSDRVGKADEHDSAKVLPPAIEGIRDIRKNVLWDPPRSLSPTQAFSAQIKHFHSNWLRDPSFHETRRRFHYYNARKMAKIVLYNGHENLLSIDCKSVWP